MNAITRAGRVTFLLIALYVIESVVMDTLLGILVVDTPWAGILLDQTAQNTAFTVSVFFLTGYAIDQGFSLMNIRQFILITAILGLILIAIFVHPYNALVAKPVELLIVVLTVYLPCLSLLQHEGGESA